MKLAGRKSVGRKLSAANYERMTADDLWRRETPTEQKANNERALAVIPRDEALDDVDSPFFLSPEAASILSADELAALDSMIERHGLKNLFAALAQLLDSRVDESLVQSGRVIHHLAREDDFAHAAERVRNLTYDDRIVAL